MVKKKTLLIVGAGASSEVGLPVGDGLMDNIRDSLNIQLSDFDKWKGRGDRVVYRALRLAAKQTGTNVAAYLLAARRIREAMPLARSIDNFIHDNREDKFIEHCGKIAIVQSILIAENKSKLYCNNRGLSSSFDFDNIQETWFVKFYKLLFENCSEGELAKRCGSIVIVIFNYDRCVEHFLVHSIQKYCGIEVEKAAALVNLIEIYHPYGKVGHLPWQQNDGVMEFGAEASREQLLKISEQIRTFTEVIEPDYKEISTIRTHVRNSEIVIFLGFAFHKINMELLKSDSKLSPKELVGHCFATAQGESDYNLGMIKKTLRKFKARIPKNIHITREEVFSCAKLFDEYWRGLSIE
jgi:hypothetical protein